MVGLREEMHYTIYVYKWDRCMEKYKATLMREPEIQRALKRISHEIIEKNGGAENLCIIGIKRRGIPLAEMLADNIYNIEGKRVEVGSIDITLYRDDRSEIPAGPVVSDSEISFNITGKNVVLVDDVLYTGRTVRAALDAIMQYGRSAKVQLAVLVDRGHRELPIRGDYVGKNVPTSKNEIIAAKIPPYDETYEVVLCEK